MTGIIQRVVRYCLFAWVLTSASADAAEPQRSTIDRVQAVLPEFERFAGETLQKSGVPGMAVAIVCHGRVVFVAGFGARKTGSSERVNGDTVFQLASMSKPIASTVVAALVGDGVVSWDDPVVRRDPGFRMYDPWVTRALTIRDLFSHRSGMFGDAGDDLERLGYDRDQILQRLQYARPASSFRSQYAYSNFGLTEGAIAAAKATGKSWEAIAKEKLYDPLGMTLTSSRYADFAARSNRANLHVLIQGQWTPMLSRDADAQSPAGGVSSSARDLAQWMRLELARGMFDGMQIIAREAIEATHMPVIMRGKNPISGQPAFYGLGWNVEYESDGSIYWGHAGAFSLGARTVVSLLPAESLGIVVLCNAFPTGLPEGIAATFFDLVKHGRPRQDWVARWNKLYDGLYGPPAIQAAIVKFAQQPRQASLALPAAAYLGTYSNAYLGSVRIGGRDGALTLALGPQQKVYPIKHLERDAFLYYPFAETPDFPSSVIFTIGADQKATQVLIDDLNEAGQGLLARDVP